MKKYIPALGFLFFLLIGCEHENPEEGTESLNTEINFYPVEIYEGNSQGIPSLKLRLITEKEFPCYNYGIISSQSIKENQLIIKIEGISKSVICATAIGPAASIFDLPENITGLKIISGNTTDIYEVNITEKIIEINTIESNFTKPIFGRTFRYPENTFAVTCGTNLEDTEICQEFNDYLTDNLDVEEFSFEGEGRIPYPDSSSGHWNNSASRFYRYQSQDELVEAAQLLETFTRENIEPDKGNSISIRSWDNQFFYSWGYD